MTTGNVTATRCPIPGAPSMVDLRIRSGWARVVVTQPGHVEGGGTTVGQNRALHGKSTQLALNLRLL